MKKPQWLYNAEQDTQNVSSYDEERKKVRDWENANQLADLTYSDNPYNKQYVTPNTDNGPDLGPYSDMWSNNNSNSSNNENASIWDKMRNSYWNFEDNADKFVKSNPMTNFLARAGQSAANVIVPGGALQDNYDTGNKWANSAADFLGMGAGFAERLPGLDYSTGTALSKTIGEPVENYLNKIGTNYGVDNYLSNLANKLPNFAEKVSPITNPRLNYALDKSYNLGKYALNNVYDYGLNALKTGAEFGAYNGVTNAIQGKDIRDGVAEGMGQGMLWGAGGKLAGDIFSHFVPGLGKVKVTNDDGNTVTFHDESGNVQNIDKATFDNAARPITQQTIDTINSSDNLTGYAPKELFAARNYNNDLIDARNYGAENSMDSLGFSPEGSNNIIKNELASRLGAEGGAKYTVKNTATEQAANEYQNAINTIYNYFGTNKLTPEEIARIKPELGIDLNQLVSNMETAKTDVRAIGDRQRLRQVAGVDNTSFNPVTETTTEQIPYVKTYRQPKVTEQVPSVVTYKEKVPAEVNQNAVEPVQKQETTSGNVNVPVENTTAPETPKAITQEISPENKQATLNEIDSVMKAMEDKGMTKQVTNGVNYYEELKNKRDSITKDIKEQPTDTNTPTEKQIPVEVPEAAPKDISYKNIDNLNKDELLKLEYKLKDQINNEYWEFTRSRGTKSPNKPPMVEAEYQLSQVQKKLGKKKEFYEMTKQQAQGRLKMPEKKHIEYIKKALEEGKQVPEEVLKDYPELQPKAEAPKYHKVNDLVEINHNGEPTAAAILKVNKDGTYEMQTEKGDYVLAKKNEKGFETVSSQPTPKEQIPMEQRDNSNVGNRKIQAYQYLHPELKSYIQDEAEAMLGELKDTQKASRYAVDKSGETKSMGDKRITSDDIAYLRDQAGMSYADIEKGLKRLVEDNGSENIAASKKIELVIDNRLSNGYKDFKTGHDVEPNKNYTDTKNKIEGTEEVATTKESEKIIENPQEQNKAIDLNSMTKDELFKAIDKTNPHQTYKPTETVVDWGNGKARGQGKRVGKMVMGGMGDAPQGKKTYLNLVGEVPEFKTNPDDFTGMESIDKINYLKAREYGLNHKQAMVYEAIKHDSHGLSDEHIMNRMKHYEEGTQPQEQPKEHSLGNWMNTVSENDISYEKGYNAHRGTSFEPERRAKQEQQMYINAMKDIYEKTKDLAKTPEQKAILEQELNRYKEKYIQHTNTILDAKSRTLSAMITGPARFPTARNEKALNVEHKRIVEFLDWQKKAEASVKKKVNGAMTEEQKGSAEFERLKEEALHTIGVLKDAENGNKSYSLSLFRNGLRDKLMRSLNNDNVEAVNKTLDFIKETEKEHLKKPVFAANNGIWKAVEAAKEKMANPPEVKTGEEPIKTYEGATIVKNHEADRVQIRFDEKPGEEVRNELKLSGWRYSPTNDAWQRKLTSNAEYSSKRIMDQHFKELTSKIEDKPIEEVKPIEEMKQPEIQPQEQSQPPKEEIKINPTPKQTQAMEQLKNRAAKLGHGEPQFSINKDGLIHAETPSKSGKNTLRSTIFQGGTIKSGHFGAKETTPLENVKTEIAATNKEINQPENNHIAEVSQKIEEQPKEKQTTLQNKSTEIWKGYEEKYRGKPLDNKESGYKTVVHEDTYGVPLNTKYPNKKMPTLTRPEKAVSEVKSDSNTNTPFEMKLPINGSKVDYKKINDVETLNKHISDLKDAISNTTDKVKLRAMNLQLFAAQDRLRKLKDIVKPELEDTTNKIVSSKDNNKFSFKQSLKNFYTRTVDIHNPQKEWSKASGDKAYVKSINSANAGSIVETMFKHALVDMKGKKIGYSLKELVNQIPKNKSEEFWNYMLHKHNVQRAALEKNVFPNYDSAASANAVKEFEKLNPGLRAAGENVTKWLNKFMDEWGHKAGLVSDDLWNTLQDMYPNYIPTNRKLSELEEHYPQGTNGKGFVNQSSPIKKAKGGSEDIINPVENIMNLVNRTVRTAKYNEVGQEILNSLRKEPEKLQGYAEILPESTKDNKVNLEHDNVVTVLDKGQKVHLQINNKPLLDSLKALNKADLHAIEKFSRQATGIFKALITTKNPLFAIRNVARDIPTYMVNTKENNPLKAAWNLGGAFKDIGKHAANEGITTVNKALHTNLPTMKENGALEQYRGVGGGGSNFFDTEHPYKSAKALTHTSKNPLHYLSEGIESFNNALETAPRLAEFKRTLKKTGDIDQALFDASDVTTNFARHGDITKHIDSAVPYLNAGVQGLDKVARQFSSPKKALATVAKGALTITAPTVALNELLNKDNDKYKQLDNRTKDNYYLFPHGDTFIKIPKSRELGVLFGSLAERTIRQIEGDPEAWKGFFKSGSGITSIGKGTVATNFAPANPLEDNIVSPYFNLKANKDFADRTIVPDAISGRSEYLQYDEKTSEIAKKIGQIANLSPKQVDYVIKSYTGVIGQMALPVATKSNWNGNKFDNLSKSVTTQFTSDPLYSNQELQNFYENIDKTKRMADDKNFLESVPGKETTHEEHLASEFTKAAKDIKDLTKAANEATQAGDMNKVRQIRQEIIKTATEANKYMNNQGTDKAIAPVSELKANIEEQIKYNTSSRATYIRQQADLINKSNVSPEQKSKLLQDLAGKASGLKQGKPPKQKKEKANPYNQ